MSRFALAVIEDGRPQYLSKTVDSLQCHLPFDDFVIRILINDAADPLYTEQLRRDYPQFERQVHHPKRRGIAGAFKSAWTTALEYDWDFLWHNEDDLCLLVNLDLESMGAVLNRYPYLSQMMMLRQPCSKKEIQAGSVILSEPDDHTELQARRLDGEETIWIEHDRWYGFNSHLVKRSVVELVVKNATDFGELGVTDVLKPAGYRFAYWGGMNDEPRIEHIGTEHSKGYRL